MEKEMEYFLNSKLIGWLGIGTFGLIGIDFKFLDRFVMDSLHVNAFFTNLYMVMFAVYYSMKIYWFWQDKKLTKKERLKKLNNNNN